MATKIIPKSHEKQINALLTMAKLLNYNTSFEQKQTQFNKTKYAKAKINIEKDNQYFSFEMLYQNRVQSHEIDLYTHTSDHTFTSLEQTIAEITYHLK